MMVALKNGNRQKWIIKMCFCLSTKKIKREILKNSINEVPLTNEDSSHCRVFLWAQFFWRHFLLEWIDDVRFFSLNGSQLERIFAFRLQELLPVDSMHRNAIGPEWEKKDFFELGLNAVNIRNTCRAVVLNLLRSAEPLKLHMVFTDP